MDAIDLLEKRIAALELEVLPKTPKNLDIDKSQVITELLLQTHSMTAAALSCREVITSILKRMEMINDYLNPSFYDSQLEMQDKKRYILELYPEMKKTVQLAVEFEHLKSCLDSQSINNIPNLVDRLDQLTIWNVNTYEECKDITEKILMALQQYSDMTVSIKILFARMEQTLADIESSKQPKVAPDE